MRYKPAPRGKGPSPHFSWQEVINNSGYPAVPIGPFLSPSGKITTPRINSRRHAKNMERLRTEVNRHRRDHLMPPTGINVLSWARSHEHNLAVGGAADSRHLYFDACDISLQEIQRLMPWNTGRTEFDTICNSIFKKGGFGTYPGGNRHVDSRGSRARWSTWVPGKRDT